MGEAAAGRGTVTIYDVARHAGVSKSLVSLVLRGSGQVSPARREAVQAAIAELGYRPSRAAASLAGQRSNTIGVVIDEFSNLWFVDLLTGLRAGLDGTGFHVSVADRALNGHLAESPVEGFLAARVDGLVIAGEPGEATGQPRQFDPPASGSAPAHASRPAGGVSPGVSVPTVVIGTRLHDVPGADHVLPDDHGGAASAVAHLVDLGHERIAFVSGPTGPAAERERGYREAMEAAGLPPLVAPAGDTTEAGGLAAVSALLGSAAGARATAVMAANDLLALGAWQALRDAGRGVPEDVSLVGYDDSPLAGTGLVRLTSVDPRNEEVGVRAAELLRARIEQPSREPRLVTVEPRLVPRATTARAR